MANQVDANPEEFHVPKIVKMKRGEAKITQIYSKYNTNIAIVSDHKLYIWGDNLVGTRYLKPHLLFSFPYPIHSVSLGLRHGIVQLIDEKRQKTYTYGWGDGTYGELGI